MKHHNRKRNVQLITVLIVPLLLIILGSLGYAAWTDQVTTIATLTSADYQIEILDCWTEYYNGEGCELLWEMGGKEISLVDEGIFPGWKIILFTKIHNKDVSQSWVAQLDYTLYYFDEEIQDWVKCDQIELFNIYGINYTGEFYLGPGPDGTWCTPDDELMPPDYEIIPCNSVYSKQTLFFDAQDHPELSDRTFSIKVIITATYPQNEQEEP